MPHVSRWGGAPVAGAVVALVLAACGSGPGSPQPYQLYTHCGIDEARIASTEHATTHVQ